VSSQTPQTGYPATLRIHFSRGERPYIFWISNWVPQDGEEWRFKVISKHHADRTLEVLVIQEGSDSRRKSIGHLKLPRDHPSGWLENWVRSLEDELGTRFHSYDLRNVQTQEEWQEVATRLGWRTNY